MSSPPFLAKAEEAATSAEVMLESDPLDSAASRAYYAVFNAARAAVVAAGLSGADHTWTREAIQGGFAQLTHRRKIYSGQLLSDLPHLHTVRLQADYAAESVSSKQARTVVKKAREFVIQVAREIIRD